MADIVDRRARSRMMAGIKGKHTKPELVVRSYLHRRGLRFRLHQRNLPGNPDIVLAKYRTAVFVHGCFWHQHEGCRFAYMPSSNTTFWKDKLQSNVARDAKQSVALVELGWRVLTLWECETRNSSALDRLVSQIRREI